MNFEIRPSISVKKTENYDLIVVTSSRPVSSQLWDVTCKFNHLGVFDRNRPCDSNKNILDTQLVFWKNPGYETEQVMSLIIPAVYLAAVWSGNTYRDCITNLWSVSLDEHINRIEKTVTIPAGHTIDPDVCKYVISTWLLSSAWSSAKGNSYDSFHSIGLSLSFTKNRVDFARASVKRLRFMNPQETFIGAETVNRYIAEIENFIPTLEEDHRLLCSLQEQIDAIKAKVNLAKDLLQIALETEEIATPELFIQWKEYIDLMLTSTKECKAIVNSFNDDACLPIILRIKEISPEK